MNIERDPQQGMRHALNKVLSTWQDGRARSLHRLRAEFRQVSGTSLDPDTIDSFIETCMVGLHGFRRVVGVSEAFWEPVKTKEMKTIAVVQGRTVTGQLMAPHRPSAELLGGCIELPALRFRSTGDE